MKPGARSLDEWPARDLYAHVARGITTLADLMGASSARKRPEPPGAGAYFTSASAVPAIAGPMRLTDHVLT
jgi:hypothetical protein